MVKKKDIRKIPSRNYLYLLCIFVISMFVFWIIVKPFEKKDDEKSLLTNKLEKLSYESINAYITERQNIIVYLTDFSEKSNDFENLFEDVVLKNEIDEDIVYMNTNDLKNNELLEIENKFFNDKLKNSKVKLNIIPNLLVFKEGMIIDILYKTDTIYDENSIMVFLENYGVINND